MPNPLTSYISQTKSVFNSARWDVGNAGTHIDSAGRYLGELNFTDAGLELVLANNDLDALSFKIHSTYGLFKYYLIDALEWIDDNWPIDTGPVEITMEAIIEAMLVADPEEVKYFIGLVDAYRSSIWNRPFNKDFYASLARGFETWE